MLLPQAEIGRHLKVAQTHISTALKQLIATGFIIRGAKVGTTYHYKINPEFFTRP
jgi:predicted transcriptional regulator